MQLIPVIDLAQGRAVQARGGDRARYRPVESVLTAGARGDAVALVQAYREVVAARECYVADLDAIQGGPLQRDLLLELVRAAGPCGLLVDAGLRDASAATEVLALGVGAVVVGLETMRSVEDLAALVGAAPARVIFSLDLRLGRPMLSPDAAGGELDGLAPEAIARLAVGAGVGALLVLDVERVGTGVGVDLDLLRRLRGSFPGVRLLAGGGVAGATDLSRLADAGCDGALVATALHTGRLAQSSASASRQVADWP